MARNVIKAYLKYGYEKEKELFYGQLSVATGKTVIHKKTGYWPRKYSDVEIIIPK